MLVLEREAETGVIYLKFEPLRVPLWVEGFGTDVGFESCTSKLQLKKRDHTHKEDVTF